jgi:hypothetical protein
MFFEDRLVCNYFDASRFVVGHKKCTPSIFVENSALLLYRERFAPFFSKGVQEAL